LVVLYINNPCSRRVTAIKRNGHNEDDWIHKSR
jgi:hypothetical protein